LISNTVAFAEDLLRYELSKDNIKRICLYEEKKGLFGVSVELNKKGRDAFSRLTGNNLGRMLIVTLSGKVLTKANIMVQIDSGIISVGELNSKETIKKIAEILTLYNGDLLPTNDLHRPGG
jgi:preprotein translocase subunit SecD